MGPKSMHKNDEKGLHEGKKRPPVREAGTSISNMEFGRPACIPQIFRRYSAAIIQTSGR
jgi:hypothetical protein